MKTRPCVGQKGLVTATETGTRPSKGRPMPSKCLANIANRANGPKQVVQRLTVELGPLPTCQAVSVRQLHLAISALDPRPPA